MQKEEINIKLKILESKGINKLLSDILKEVYQDMGEDEGISGIAYQKYANRIIEKLRKQYHLKIKGEQVASKQGDLEILIAQIKSGEVPEFVNKVNSKL
jgi:lauroyl/myristoyl acyltransferase